MTTVRSAKNKGSQGEYSTFDSLKPIYPDIKLTKELGFVSQYDLVSERFEIAIECKFHRSISWNKAKKFFLKLKDKAPKGYDCYLIFKSNQQPVLVMFETEGLGKTPKWIGCMEFESYFETPWVKHTKRKV